MSRLNKIGLVILLALTMLCTLLINTAGVKAEALPEPLPESLFTYDAGSNMFVLTVTDENKDEIAAYNDIRIVTNHQLVVATDLVIPGDLVIDFFGAITINKGCTITAGTVSIGDIVNIKLGDKNCIDGLGLSASDLKIKHTGDPFFYNFPIDDIDDTEFMKENGKLVYKDGPDCGINMNSDGTCQNEEGSIKYGDVYYEVYTNQDDLVPAYSGTLTEEWASVDFAPDKFKIGSRIDFTVKAYNGKVMQSNGVRFPDNKTYISTPEEEAKANTSEGCKCSYILTEAPDRYLSITVHFVDPSEVLDAAEFSWSYDSRVQEVDIDKFTSHGTIEVVSATKDGASVINTHNPDNAPYWTEGTETIHMEEDDPERGHHEWDEMQGKFEAGTKVVVRLVPDRGYQLTHFTISNIEKTTTPVDGVNEYTFNLVRPDYYNLCAVFTQVEDEVDSSGAAKVSGGNVSFAEGEVENGTVALNVSDATASLSEQRKFAQMAYDDGYKIDQTLSIGVEQRFYKATENATRDQCWVQPMNQELSAPANIELNVSGITSADIEILHNHNGKYEVIPAKYENGVVSFKTGSFSDFAIVTKEVIPDSNLWCAPIPDQAYTGKIIKPVPKVYYDKKLLEAGKDYKITYGKYNKNLAAKDAVKNGKSVAPSITITYNGKPRDNKITVNFAIVPCTMDTVDIDDFAVLKTGKARKITPVVTCKGKKLKLGKDYVISTSERLEDAVKSYTDEGVYKLYAVGINNYTGAAPFNFVITTDTLASKVKITKIPEQNYDNGKEIKPVVKVTYKKEDVTDKFDISYKNNSEVGTAAVIITAKKNSGFAGSKRVNFKIIGNKGVK